MPPLPVSHTIPRNRYTTRQGVVVAKQSIPLYCGDSLPLFSQLLHYRSVHLNLIWVRTALKAKLSAREVKKANTPSQFLLEHGLYRLMQTQGQTF